jgi:hypothetical protein
MPLCNFFFILASYLQLCIGPTRDLDNHVQDGLLLIGEERDVVEWRDRCSILLNVATVLESVGGTDLADSVLGGLAVRHCGGLGRCGSGREMSSDGFGACRSYARVGGSVEGGLDGFEGGGRQLSSGVMPVRARLLFFARAADRAVRN